MTSRTTQDYARTVSEMFQCIAGDLSMLSDSELEVSGITVEERTDRPAADGDIHISFRFALDDGGVLRHGTLLLPISASISLGAHLMMAAESQVEDLQREQLIDGPLREAILEVGAFVTGALQTAMQSVGSTCRRVVFEGCQGVPAAVPPVLAHDDGDPLVVSRAALRVGRSPAKEAILVLPDGDFLVAA